MITKEIADIMRNTGCSEAKAQFWFNERFPKTYEKWMERQEADLKREAEQLELFP